MTFQELYSLTPRSFFNAVNGNRKKEDAFSKERWLMTRKIMHATLMPHLKNQQEEHDILPFEWENNQIEKIKKDRILSAADDLKRMNEYWERQDAHAAANKFEK